MPIIETIGLTKYYRKTPGLIDLNLEINEGEIFGFLGPNGAGKTTTIRLLMDFIRPTRGSAKIFGYNVRKDSLKIREDVGNLPGDVHLYEHLNGKEFLDYISKFKKRPAKLRDSLAERFELDLNKRIRDYSKGMRQKLGIIQALMNDPPLLILDEPTIGLDPLMQMEFYRVLREFRERGCSIFMSSHILPEVEKICDRVGIIKESKLVTVAKIEELKHRRVKKMEIIFAENVSYDKLEHQNITKIEGRDSHYVLYIKGNPDPIIKKIAKFNILDMVLEEAKLEDIFLEYY